MENNQNNIGNRLLEIIERTTFHAIPNIFKTKSYFVKLVWATFLVLSVYCCILNIKTLVDTFLSNPINTKVELLKSHEIEFPTVTFCNLQICGFEDYTYKKYLEKYKIDERLKFGTDQSEVIDEKLKKNKTKTSFFSAKEIFLRQYNEKELIKLLGPDENLIKKMLINCEFNGEKCNDNDFDYFLMGEFQKCYKFNSGKLNRTEVTVRNTKKFGPKSGLHMELFLGTQKDCQSPLSTTSGLIVYIHNKTYTLTEEDDAIQIKPGTEASIAVETTSVKKLSDPYSDCFESEEKSMAKVSNTTLIKNTVNLTRYYTQQYCLQLCYQEFLMDFCDCYDHTLPNFTPANYSTCPKFIDSLYNCQYLIKKLFYNGKNDEHCLKRCPKECEYMTYSTTVSYLQFPTNSYLDIMKLLKRNGKIDSATESLLALNVFYESSSFKKITENPAIETTIFATNIGGTIGLFLGVSALVMVEFLEFFIEIAFSFCTKITNKNKSI